MTDFEVPRAKDGRFEGILRKIMADVRRAVPLGEGKSHGSPRRWKGFDEYLERVGGEKPGWMDARTWDLATRSLGTLGGGNHFIEIQRSADGTMWLMLHSGSRNLGYRIASWHYKRAVEFARSEGLETPN
jgi:tRNA-splicing ligase RtcB